MLHEDGVITPKQVWVKKKNYINTYIVGAFDGLIRENRLKMHGMSSCKSVCHRFVTFLINHDTEKYN